MAKFFAGGWRGGESPQVVKGAGPSFFGSGDQNSHTTASTLSETSSKASSQLSQGGAEDVVSASVTRRASALVPRPLAAAIIEFEPINKPPKRAQGKPRAMSIQNSSASDFEPIRLLGKGAFGAVVLVRRTTGHTAGKQYAMKVMSKAELVDRGVVETARVEREILRSTRHPFLVWLCYAFQTKTKLYLVTEYFEGGSLDQSLAKGLLGEDRVPLAKKIGAQCALAMAHLHERAVIHRDVKAGNVLLDRKGNAHLGDYGLAAYCDRESQTAKRRSFCGTIAYMAPELLLNTEKYTGAVDYWALGCLVYEIIDGRKTPFHCQSSRELFTKILHAEPTFDEAVFDPAARRCLGPLLDKDPTKRAGVAALRRDGFLDIAHYEARIEDLMVIMNAEAAGLSVDSDHDDDDHDNDHRRGDDSKEDPTTPQPMSPSMDPCRIRKDLDFLRSVDGAQPGPQVRPDAFAGFGYRMDSVNGESPQAETRAQEMSDIVGGLPSSAPSTRYSGPSRPSSGSFMRSLSKRFLRKDASSQRKGATVALTTSATPSPSRSNEKDAKSHRRVKSDPLFLEP